MILKSSLIKIETFIFIGDLFCSKFEQIIIIMGISEPKKVPTRSRIKYRQDQVISKNKHKYCYNLIRILTNVVVWDNFKNNCYMNMKKNRQYIFSLFIAGDFRGFVPFAPVPRLWKYRKPGRESGRVVREGGGKSSYFYSRKNPRQTDISVFKILNLIKA